MVLSEKYESLCSSVCLLKYFTEMMTGRTFSRIILSHSVLSYSSFCVNMFSENILLLVPCLAKSQQKTLLNIRKFDCFLNRLWPIFFFLETNPVY